MASDPEDLVIPDLLRAVRRARGLTQENLAQELGVTFSTVNGWENGRHQPIPLLMRSIVKLATASGVEVDPRVLQARRRRGRQP